MIVDYTFTSEMYVYAANESPGRPAGGRPVPRVSQIPGTPSLNARLLAEIPVGGARARRRYRSTGAANRFRRPSIDFGGFINANWPTPRTYGMAVSYRW